MPHDETVWYDEPRRSSSCPAEPAGLGTQARRWYNAWKGGSRAMTITLTPALEARIREQATREGREPEMLVDALLSAALDWEAQDRAEAIAGVRRGLEASAAGRVRGAAEVFTEMRARLAQAA